MYLRYVICKFYQSNWWPSYKRHYEFTTDWFTHHISKWKKILSPLRNRQNICALEIGTYEGRSALWLLENILTSSTARLVCIDPYPGDLSVAQERFQSNLQLGGFNDKVQLIKGFSNEVLPTLEANQFDLIYIDGNHDGEQVLADAELSWKLLKHSGILIFDDYKLRSHKSKRLRPKQGIDFFLKHYARDLEVLSKGYQIFIRKRDE